MALRIADVGILQILGISLLDKTPVNELFTNIDYKNVKELNYNQLSLSLFLVDSNDNIYVYEAQH